MPVQRPADPVPFRPKLCLFLSGHLDPLADLQKLSPNLIHILLLSGACQKMQPLFYLLRFPPQRILLRLDHIPVAHMVPKLFLQCVQLPGQLLVLDPGDLQKNLVHLPENRLLFIRRRLLQTVQFLNKTCQQMHLLLFLLFLLLIALCLFPDGRRLLPEQTDRISPADLGLVVLILRHIFFQKVLKFLHPVPLPVQLVLHCIQKPFLHQPLLIPAVGKEL